jgi:hypothetical protein
MSLVCPEIDLTSIKTEQVYFYASESGLYPRGYIAIPNLIGNDYPEKCLASVEIVSATTAANFALGDSYAHCGFVGEQCENPLGEGVTTDFYIGSLNLQRNMKR